MFTITYKALAALVIGLGAVCAQSPATDAAAPATPAVASAPGANGTQTAPLDNRIFGVLPNYRTADSDRAYQPITTHQKYYIAFKDTTDWPNYLLGGAFAALYQLEDSNPSFGQGMKGYAHRYITAYADQSVGNMLTEAVLPSLFHEDPRYFRQGQGSKWRRTGYAATRILITRTDRGGTRFNTSEVLGNAMTASLANAYYTDNRSFSDTMQRLCVQLATDSFSNVLKEFWPDIKQKWLHK